MDAPILALVVAGLIMLAVNAYVVLGGADFGAGVWDLLARGPRAAAQRAAIAEGIGPIWEANHVWVIFVVVLLFSCFPPVFARLSVVLHIPLTLMLVGIVLRGSAFTLINHGTEGLRMVWGAAPAEMCSAADPAVRVVCSRFPATRAFMMLVALFMLLSLWLLLTRTRIGLVIQAALTHPEMVEALGHKQIGRASCRERVYHPV